MMCPYCGSVDLENVGIAYRCDFCCEIVYPDELIYNANLEEEDYFNDEYEWEENDDEIEED